MSRSHLHIHLRTRKEYYKVFNAYICNYVYSSTSSLSFNTLYTYCFIDFNSRIHCLAVINECKIDEAMFRMTKK